jgi:hypothetical protein
MKIQIQFLAAVVAVCLAGCAASSVKHSWKAPNYQGGPVQKVAVIGVEERGLVRQGFENRFVRDLRAHGQEAIVTHDLMTLPDIKADKKAAAARLMGAGADSVLIVRLVDQSTFNHQVAATPQVYVETVTGVSDYYGWYDYYEVAFMNMGTVWSDTVIKVYLDTTLYDLKSGQRLWSAMTLTTLKDGADRLAEADTLVAKVVAAVRKDGLVR